MLRSLFLLTCTIFCVVHADSRCFLENGGSGESFFVSEALPIGSTIGVLSVHGNPTEHTGDISLRLQRSDSPVQIAPGSKNLTLTRQLDKEGILGPSSVYVNVVCERRGISADPVFIVPVSIRVTDANDNAPEFVNGPYILNISEVTVLGTRVLQGIRAIDRDQQGPFSTVQYSVLPGPFADHFVFLNGLEGTLVLRRKLDYETANNFSIKIRAQDQGNPPQYTDTEVQVNVIDADDQNPAFLSDRYAAVLPPQPVRGYRLKISPQDINAVDQDKGINAPVYYSFNADGGDYQLFHIDPSTGVVTVAKDFIEDDLQQPATLVIRATQVDNKDRYALTTLTISRKGAVQVLHFLQELYLAAVLENAPVNSVLITVVTNRPRDKRLRYWLDKEDGVFGVTSNGDIVLLKPLDYEVRDVYVFRAHVTDGRVNDTSIVNITVLNVNDWDPRFRYPQYEFFISDPSVGAGYIVGNIEAADGDRGDKVTLSLRGPHANLFQLTQSGQLSINSLDNLNTTEALIIAVATDSGLPPRQATVPIKVHFPTAVVKAANTWAVGGTSFLVVTVFSTLLIVLLLVIAALGFQIHKGKRRKKVEDSSVKSTSSASTDCKSSEGSSISPNIMDVDGRVFNVGTLPKRNPQYTATVKSIMSRAGSSRNFHPIGPVVGGRTGVRVAPLHSSVMPSAVVAPNTQIVAPQITQIPEEQECTCSLGSREWVEGSIPRRVKKLSWDDDSNDNDNIQIMEDSLEGYTQADKTSGRNKSNVQRMLSVMSQQSAGDSMSQNDVAEFLVTGRTGRRNALPDILGPHAHTSISDLPERLQSLCSMESDTTTSGPSTSQPSGETNQSASGSSSQQQ